MLSLLNCALAATAVLYREHDDGILLEGEDSGLANGTPLWSTEEPSSSSSLLHAGGVLPRREALWGGDIQFAQDDIVRRSLIGVEGDVVLGDTERRWAHREDSIVLGDELGDYYYPTDEPEETDTPTPDPDGDDDDDDKKKQNDDDDDDDDKKDKNKKKKKNDDDDDDDDKNDKKKKKKNDDKKDKKNDKKKNDKKKKNKDDDDDSSVRSAGDDDDSEETPISSADDDSSDKRADSSDSSADKEESDSEETPISSEVDSEEDSEQTPDSSEEEVVSSGDEVVSSGNEVVSSGIGATSADEQSSEAPVSEAVAAPPPRFTYDNELTKVCQEVINGLTDEEVLLIQVSDVQELQEEGDKFTNRVDDAFAIALLGADANELTDTLTSKKYKKQAEKLGLGTFGLVSARSPCYRPLPKTPMWTTKTLFYQHSSSILPYKGHH